MDKRGTYEKMVEMMKNCCPKEGEMTDCCSKMQKMMDQKGVGSFCAEMMEKIKKHQDNDGSFQWEEMMQKMINDCNKP